MCFATAVVASLVAPSITAAQVNQRKVLVLFSTRRDAEIARVIERELPRVLNDAVPGGIDYYAEYIDRARFPNLEYRTAFLEFLVEKYRGERFDAVLAIQSPAVALIAEHRDVAPFKGVPLVFTTVAPVAARPTDSTGIIVPINFHDTIAMAKTLQPGLRRIYVVSGADPQREEYLGAAREELAAFASTLEVDYFTGLVSADLEQRLATLPPQSAVFYLVANRDGTGKALHPLEYVSHVSAVANAPVYSWVDSTMGRGVVGGALKSQEQQAQSLGELTARVINGESADAIAITTNDFTVPQADARQLARWNISASRIPPGTRLLYQPPSAWDQYKRYIVAGAAILLTETVLVVGLFLQVRRARRAEQRLRASETALRESLIGIRDLGARLIRAHDDERSWVARQLLDDVSQRLALLAINVEILTQDTHAPTRRLASDALTHANDAVLRLHQLSQRLHPARLELVGLVGAVDGLRRDWSAPGIDITFAHDAVPGSLPESVTLCMFRVVEEALRNAVTHGDAGAIHIAITGHHGTLRVEVTDDGSGFSLDEAREHGLGLRSMKERLDALGGSLVITSAPESGTRVVAAVPLAPFQAAVSQ